MPRPATDKRERLADAALDLAHRQGFERASIADIATHAGIAPGSVYYYFKTKDDVGRAVVERLGTRYGQAMERWNGLAGPVDRLGAFVRSYVDDVDAVRRHGCPLGSVCAELAKQDPALGAEAGEVFGRLIAWATEQFAELGWADDDAAERGRHVVVVMQGAAALASALDSPDPVEREAEHLVRWIREAPDR